MNKKIILKTNIKFYILLSLIFSINHTVAGSVDICTGNNSSTGYSSGSNPSYGCENSTGVGLYENYLNNFSQNTASIGIGIDNDGKKVGAVYIYAPNGTTINSNLTLENHKITDIADATDVHDAVNLGQMNIATADAINQSNAYTDTQISNVINDISDLSDQTVHYDKNIDGSVNKDSVTFEGGATGTRLSNVATGQVSSNSKDAINGSQLNQTNQVIVEYLGGGAAYNNITQSFNSPTYQIGNNNYNNVGDALAALNLEDIAMNNRIDRTNKRIDSLESKIDDGLAMAAAINGIFQPYNIGRLNMSAAIGGYNSQHAFAVGSGYRFNDQFAVKSGLAFNQRQGSLLYNVGMNFEW